MLLKKLSEAFGVSGAEDEVRNILRKDLEEFGSITTDSLGNLFVNKDGKQNKPTIMLCAHMDEVGLMIKSIENNGWLRFATIGGIDERILVSKSVVIGPNKVRGVIGAKAIHLQKPSERKLSLKTQNLFIDIGAKSKEDAESLISIGDYAVFDTKFNRLDENIVSGKAFDDRVGCYILSKVLKQSFAIPITGVFTVQEEIGLRGSAVAAYKVNPDIAIVLEGTFASDVPNNEEEEWITTLGKGPAITFMDTTYIAQRRLLNRIFDIAQKNKIPYQLKRAAFGGTDGGRIYTTREGIPTIIISVPSRYIHSPVSIVNTSDIENTISLVTSIIKDFQERGVELT